MKDKVKPIIGVVALVLVVVVLCLGLSRTGRQGNSGDGSGGSSESFQSEESGGAQTAEDLSGKESSEEAPPEKGPDLSVIAQEIEVEVGTPEVTALDFVAGTENEEEALSRLEGELTLMASPTQEELAAVGGVYEVMLTYCGQELTASVKVVDTVPPVIEGAEDITIYEGETVSYKKNIQLSDNSGETPTLEIGNEEADTSVPGDYPIRYVATDASGNSTTVEITLHVLSNPGIDVEMVAALADAVIAKTVTEGMSQYDQAYALWLWCRKNITYSYSAGDRTSVWTGAYEGLKAKKGDCYTYYATYEVLLTRCGIPNMCVARVGGTSNHWWNLVNVGDGWYHCDSSPRHKRHPYLCFMQTDAQVQAYTESYPEHPNYYTFDPDLYPERATDIIFEGK